MQFEYEISAETYVSSQRLFRKMFYESRGGFNRNAIVWIATGAFFIVIALQQGVFDWVPILLCVTGAWWIYSGMCCIFPQRSLRKAYKAENFVGKKFSAHIDEEGVAVFSDLRDWHVRWQGMILKGEDKHVFILYDGGVIYMFGKEWLTEEQQRELRELSGIVTQ